MDKKCKHLKNSGMSLNHPKHFEYNHKSKNNIT